MKKGIFVLLLFANLAQASSPVWTFVALTPTTISVPSNGTGIIQYTVTNQSRRTRTLVMSAISGVAQDVSGSYCKNPFNLAYQQSCILKLNITGSQLAGNISGGPVVCEQGTQGLQCYEPSVSDILNITLASPIPTAVISISGSPLTLVTNGVAGHITVTNTSTELTATNVTAELTGTALNGNVTVVDSNCTSIPALGSCTLNFIPLSTVVPATSFNIQGSNTNAVSASMGIAQEATFTSIVPNTGSASGGVGVTITGSGLTGTTSVTFDGIAATSVNVVNSTTITAVTPAHAAGAVNVVMTTPSGSVTLNNGFTYQTTVIGQSAYGGKIACLNSGNNLIAAKDDISPAIQWGGAGTITNATSTTNGATNTASISTVLGLNGGNSYAAKLCLDYEIDAQGNTPCQSGNTCYSDWFLPAGNNSTASGQLNCLYTNRNAIGGFTSSPYWSSTENTAFSAWGQSFLDGNQNFSFKSIALSVRCVRTFTP